MAIPQTSSTSRASHWPWFAALAPCWLFGCSAHGDATECPSDGTRATPDHDYCSAAHVEACCRSYCDETVLSDECQASLGVNVNRESQVDSCFPAAGRDCDGDGVAYPDDCADCDPLRYRHVEGYTDEDSDGYPSRKASVCAGDPLPDGFVTDVEHPELLDCDDGSAERFQYACRDADADGWCAEREECVGETPPHYRNASSVFRGGGWLWRDCDDTDSAKQILGFADEDGDGFRAAYDKPTGCYPYLETPPTSYSYGAGNDCNDRDPLVFPEQADLVGDGLDANCDGSDGVPGATCDNACLCWPTSLCTAAATCSDRPDLAIEAVIPGSVQCKLSNTAAIAVVNRGGVAYQGTLLVTESDFYGGELREPYCWYDTVIQFELQPGQGKVIEVDPLCQRPALIITSGDDCLADNNSLSFHTKVSCDR